MSKIFTVFGATGQQGGSVVAAVLRHPELSKIYKVRAVTRDTTKPSAQKLKEQGAEVVKADMNDPASLRDALKGADAAFGVTNFWDGVNSTSELTQGKALADAAVAEGVNFLIFSALPNVSRVTNGRLKQVSHFDSKAHVEEYIRTLPIKSAFFWPGGFMQNYITDGPQPNGDGTFTFSNVWAADSKLPLIDVSADAGKFVTPLLANPDKFNHRRMYGASGFYTPQQMVSTWTAVTGKTVTYKEISEEAFKAMMPPAMADELYENMILMKDYQYFGPEGKGPEAEVQDTLAELTEKTTTFEEFVKKNTWF